MRDNEAPRGDWATYYLSFDGHGVVPANNAPMRLLAAEEMTHEH